MIYKKAAYLTLFNFVLVFIFACIYYFIREQFNGLNKDSSFLDCIYYSSTTMSSVGYGDIFPITNTSKIMVVIQQFLVLIGIAALVIDTDESPVNCNINNENNIRPINSIFEQQNQSISNSTEARLYAIEKTLVNNNLLIS